MKQSSGLPIEMWVCNQDGSNQTQISVALPADVQFSSINSNRASFKISLDGEKVFFVGFNSSTNISSIFSCDISGANLQEVVNGGSSILELGGLN